MSNEHCLTLSLQMIGCHRPPREFPSCYRGILADTYDAALALIPQIGALLFCLFRGPASRDSHEYVIKKQELI